MDITNSVNAAAAWSGPLACLPVSRSMRDVIKSESAVRDASVLMARSADDVAADVRRAIHKAEYDTCSGDSCWVRQYLEWSDPAIAVPTEVGIGLVPAGVPWFHAT